MGSETDAVCRGGLKCTGGWAYQISVSTNTGILNHPFVFSVFRSECFE